MAGGPQKLPAASTTALQRLYHVEKRIVHAVELAGSVMEQLGSTGGVRSQSIENQIREFVQSVKEVQSNLREEIKGSCDYRAYENCDYAARMLAEIQVQKLNCILGQMDDMQEVINQYHSPPTP